MFYMQSKLGYSIAMAGGWAIAPVHTNHAQTNTNLVNPSSQEFVLNHLNSSSQDFTCVNNPNPTTNPNPQLTPTNSYVQRSGPGEGVGGGWGEGRRRQ